jgi:arsenate reductase
MAEGLVNHFLSDRWVAFSAGVAPAQHVHLLAIRAMAELGIDISAQRPKLVDEFENSVFDVLITLCGHATESCPVWIGPEKRVHLGFPDPAAVTHSVLRTGDEVARLAVFRQVRDDIRQHVFEYLAQMEES